MPFRRLSSAFTVQGGGDGEQTHHPVWWQRQHQPQPQQWVLGRKAKALFYITDAKQDKQQAVV